MPRTLPPLELRTLHRTIEVVFSEAAKLPPGKIMLLSKLPAGINQIVLQHEAGHPPSDELLRNLFSDFLKNLAHAELAPLLLKITAENGFPPPSHIRIGAPRSRWASRSSSGTISLSIHLLFLPEALTRHVLLHELCHIEHMDHSPAFYAKLKSFDPLSEVHQNALKHAMHNYVPRLLWL